MDAEHPPIVNWSRTARRLRLALSALGVVVIVVWLAFGLAGDGFRLSRLAELAGVAILLALVLEAVIVGGAALRGMFVAGSRGDRLARPDVALFPPQLLRGRGGGAGTEELTDRSAHDGDAPAAD